MFRIFRGANTLIESILVMVVDGTPTLLCYSDMLSTLGMRFVGF